MFPLGIRNVCTNFLFREMIKIKIEDNAGTSDANEIGEANTCNNNTDKDNRNVGNNKNKRNASNNNINKDNKEAGISNV